MKATAAILAVTIVVMLPLSAWSAEMSAPPATTETQTSSNEAGGNEPAGSKEHAGRLRQACKADAKKLCSNIRLGGGRMLRCLEDHAADLSPACRDALDAAPSKP
jgi:hypothetical protein